MGFILNIIVIVTHSNIIIIYSLAKCCIQQTQRLLQHRARSVDALDYVISKHQDELKKQQESTSLSQATATSNQQQISEVILDSDDDDEIPPAPPTRSRGRWVCHNKNVIILLS